MLIGKSHFGKYLQLRLSRQKKPFLVCSTLVSGNGFYAQLHCADGVWNVSAYAFTHELLTTPAFRDIVVICDENLHSQLPFVRQVGGEFSGLLVFITSPKLSNIDKDLESNWQSEYETFIMNPWTMFEMELM